MSREGVTVAMGSLNRVSLECAREMIDCIALCFVHDDEPAYSLIHIIHMDRYVRKHISGLPRAADVGLCDRLRSKTKTRIKETANFLRVIADAFLL